MIHFTSDNDVVPVSFMDMQSSASSMFCSEASMDSLYSNASMDSRNSQAIRLQTTDNFFHAEKGGKRKYSAISSDQDESSLTFKSEMKKIETDEEEEDTPYNQGNQKQSNKDNPKRRRPRPRRGPTQVVH